MAAHLSFFPVANGDMTLVQTEGDHTILIDMNIRATADDPDDDTPDVASKLRQKLSRDAEGRLYVDALLVSRLLAPLPTEDDEEEVPSKNNSSTIVRFSLTGGGIGDKCRFLTAGMRRS